MTKKDAKSVEVELTDYIEENSAENSPENESVKDSRKKMEPDHKEIPLVDMTKDELLGKIKELHDASNNSHDLYVRTLAEIDNLKKRFKKEKEELIKFSNTNLISELLTVMDNLENAINHSEKNNRSSFDALIEGVILTLKGLKDTLEKFGLEDVKAVGEPFDPNYHDAVLEIEDNDADPGSIIQEYKKGYTLNKRLIRPAMVVVNKKASNN